jgi:hypothetical protein
MKVRTVPKILRHFHRIERSPEPIRQKPTKQLERIGFGLGAVFLTLVPLRTEGQIIRIGDPLPDNGTRITLVQANPLPLEGSIFMAAKPDPDAIAAKPTVGGKRGGAIAQPCDGNAPPDLGTYGSGWSSTSTSTQQLAVNYAPAEEKKDSIKAPVAKKNISLYPFVMPNDGRLGPVAGFIDYGNLGYIYAIVPNGQRTTYGLLLSAGTATTKGILSTNYVATATGTTANIWLGYAQTLNAFGIPDLTLGLKLPITINIVPGKPAAVSSTSPSASASYKVLHGPEGFLYALLEHSPDAKTYTAHTEIRKALADWADLNMSGMAVVANKTGFQTSITSFGCGVGNGFNITVGHGEDGAAKVLRIRPALGGIYAVKSIGGRTVVGGANGVQNFGTLELILPDRSVYLLETFWQGDTLLRANVGLVFSL